MFKYLTVLFLALAISHYTFAEPDGTCPEEDPTDGPGTYLADKSNCAGFYACVAGNPIQMYCAPGSYWNPEDNYCEIGATHANCGTRPTTPKA